MSELDDLQDELYEQVFQMPQAQDLKGRTSSITNAFVNSILPKVPPTPAEIREALKILEMDVRDVRCAYCGDPHTEWDHLRPVVLDRKPTGYISEITNLVPSCGKCNQSKGNKPWEKWMRSAAKRSPKTRGISDLEQRIARLKRYEAWRRVEPLELHRIVGEERWDAYWQSWKQMLEAIASAQKLADELSEIIVKHRRSIG